MTEEEKEKSGQIPPKVKLGSNGANGIIPKAKAVSGPKSDTSRIDIPRAKAVSGPKSDTSRIDMPREGLQTDAPIAKKPADETMRVVLPRADQVETGTLRKSTHVRPKTIRIKRPTAVSTKTPTSATGITSPVARARTVRKPGEDTSRIDLSQAQAAPSEKQIEIAKEDTMQILLDDAADTGPITEMATKSPRTIQIQREEGLIPESETILATAGDSKSATAKLDIPDAIADIPVASKKTIRIKRSGIGADDGSKKTLKISRPERTGATLSATAEEHRDTFFEEEESRPHIIFTIAALFTVIITGVLIYVLCTQMPFGAKLPWPGKIITEWQGPTNML